MALGSETNYRERANILFDLYVVEGFTPYAEFKFSSENQRRAFYARHKEYRAALLLMAVITVTREIPRLQPLLEATEILIFGSGPDQNGDLLNRMKAAMVSLHSSF